MVASLPFLVGANLMNTVGSTAAIGASALSAGGTAAMAGLGSGLGTPAATGLAGTFGEGLKIAGGGLGVGNSTLGIMGSSGGKAADAAKGFLGMDPKQAEFWSMMAQKIGSPVLKKVALMQRDKKGKLNKTGKLLATAAGAMDAFGAGEQLSRDLTALAAPGQGTDGRPKKPDGEGGASINPITDLASIFAT